MMNKIAIAALALVGRATADVFVCNVPGTGSCSDYSESFFTDVGLNFPNVVENTNNVVVLPGPPGASTLTFNALADTGSYNYCFGFCLANDITPSVLAAVSAPGATHAQRRAFAEECLITHGVAVFDDIDISSPSDPAATTAISGVPVPNEIIFFLLPNDKAADFASNTAAFYPVGTATTSARPTPLFSRTDANPQSKDQLVLFDDGVNTIFGWEDIDRSTGGDQDFSDLVFRADFVLMPDLPSPCAPQCGMPRIELYEDGAGAAPPAGYDGGDYSYTSDDNCACLGFTTGK